MRFGLLGSLQAVDDHGDELEVSAAKHRVVLAALLLNADRVVSRDALVDALWDEDPPPNASATLRLYLARLRRALGQSGARITSVPAGYRIEIAEPAELDLLEVEQLWRSGLEAAQAGQHARAAEMLRQAEAMWRGAPLADVPSERLHRDHLGRLAELQLQIGEARIDADLESGRGGELVAELRSLVAAHPLRERSHAQLMLALYRAGRRGEALAAYHDARRILRDELGADPTEQLRELHQRILVGDPTLILHPAASSAALPTPRELPPDTAGFTSREAELAAITRNFHAAGKSGATVAISAVHGTGGIGKTWLALRWVHDNLDLFPDGQLFVDLHGYSASGKPADLAEILRGFIEALGGRTSAEPDSLDTLTGQYRSLIAHRRMAVVLDNAENAAQVIPLLPGGAGCAVLVTSRDRLDGLVTGYGARPLRVDPLTDSAAASLLAARLGSQRLDAEPEAVTELIARCAGFPLALSVICGRAEVHPDFPLATLADELREASSRLDALDSADAGASVPAALSWSYDALTPDQAATFRLLGLAPGADITVPAVAALTGAPSARARAYLHELERLSLLQQHVPGRFRMHDLIRLYAAQHATLDQSRDQAESALRRIVDFYTRTAFAGDRLLNPDRPAIEIGAPEPGVQPIAFADEQAALTWFEEEHATLLATQQLAAEAGWHRAVWHLAWTLNTFHWRRGRVHDDLAACRAGLLAAEQLQDPAVLTLALRRLGSAQARVGLHTEAVATLTQAMEMARDVGDALSEGHTHMALVQAYEQNGDDRQALAHSTTALPLFRSALEPVWEAMALNAIGWYSARMGDYDQSDDVCQAALTIYRKAGRLEGEAATLDSLGYIAHQTSKHRQAVEYYNRAIELYQTVGSTFEVANTLERLGDTYAAMGDDEHARTEWHRSLRLHAAEQRTSHIERLQRRLEK